MHEYRLQEKLKRQRQPMSCREIERGNCEGWMLLKVKSKSRLIPKTDWTRYWFVLTNKTLDYFDNPNEDSYTGRVHLPGFTVKSKKGSSQKYALRIEHKDVGSYTLAAPQAEDRMRWLNKLYEASRVDIDNEDCSNQDVPSEDTKNTSFVTPLTADPSTGDDICELLESLHRSHVSVFGDSRDVVNKRRTVWFNTGITGYDDVITQQQQQQQQHPVSSLSSLSSSSSSSSKSDYHAKCSHLLALRRTLKDKENELTAIDELFCTVPITSTLLRLFTENHSTIISQLSSS